MIITIDGGVGTGKSTVAKQLAKRIGFDYFDTGAMYRCFTYGMQKHGVDLNDVNGIKTLLSRFQFNLKLIDGVKHYFYEEEDVTNQIRTPEISALVSEVAKDRSVRERLVMIQQELSKEQDAVFEGRDIGTVVFPDADLKIFLSASVDVRAKRRYEELKAKFPEKTATLSYEEVRESVASRDETDSTREVSPLLKAEDAIEIDTSPLTVDEVVDAIIALLKPF